MKKPEQKQYNFRNPVHSLKEKVLVQTNCIEKGVSSQQMSTTQNGEPHIRKIRFRKFVSSTLSDVEFTGEIIFQIRLQVAEISPENWAQGRIQAYEKALKFTITPVIHNGSVRSLYKYVGSVFPVRKNFGISNEGGVRAKTVEFPVSCSQPTRKSFTAN